MSSATEPPRLGPGTGIDPGTGRPSETRPGPQPPGMWPRVVATILDLAVVGIAWFVAVWLFLEVLTLTGAVDPATLETMPASSVSLTSQQYALALFAGAILFALRGAYLVYAWSSLGRTPGQELAGIAIVDVRTGGRLPAGRSLVRWLVAELPGFGLLLSVGILVWYGLIALTIVRSPSRRGLHDVVSGSAIVRRPREARGSRGSVPMSGSMDTGGQAPGQAPGQEPRPWTAPPEPPHSDWGPPPGGAPSSWAPPPPAGPAAGIVYAGFGARLVAYIIDGIILAIIEGIVSGILLGTSFAASGTIGYTSLVGAAVVSLVISAGYFIYTWTRMRASPGDRILGLMVLNAADGAPLTTNQATLRWLLLVGPGALGTLARYDVGTGVLIGLLVFLWYLYLAWTTFTDARRQGFHDKYVQSVVVRASLR